MISGQLTHPTFTTSRPVKVMKFVRAFFAGGTERQFINLAVSLDPSRVAVHFGCFRRSGDAGFLDEIEGCGLPVFDYDVRSFRHPAVVASQLRLARDIRRHGIQIVHTYGFAAHLFAIPAARLAGACVVASIRDMGVYLSPNHQRMQRWVCAFADHILVNANAIREWLVESGYNGRRITVVPNGIDVARFARMDSAGTMRHELGLPGNVPLIGAVGRISRFKGLEDFLNAAVMIRARFPEARFLIIGGRAVTDGPYLGELTALSTQLGLQDHVLFTGFRPDVERILGELSVSVLPSLSEGLSNTLLESMSAGIPVVATRVGGTAEAIQDEENGLLVPAGDPHSMAAAVCRLLAGPALANRLSGNAQRTVAERYSMSRVVESTSDLYERLVKQRLSNGAPLLTPELDAKSGGVFHG